MKYLILFFLCFFTIIVMQAPSLAQSNSNISSSETHVSADMASSLVSHENSDINNYLLLKIIIDDVEMEDVTEAYEKNGRIYLPLTQISTIFDFPIIFNSTKNTATGWFIREQNIFSLNRQQVEVKGKTTPLKEDDLFIRDDIYVDSALIQEWFPMNFSVDFHRLILNIATREALPFQAKKLREKAHAGLEKKNISLRKETVKDVPTPYVAVQWPVADLTISPSYASRNDEARADYSIIAVGDLGYLTSRLYMAGNLVDDTFSDIRLSFGRDDYERNLLGPLNASSFRFGDVNSTSLSQTITPMQGRGFTISNRALDRADN